MNKKRNVIFKMAFEDITRKELILGWIILVPLFFIPWNVIGAYALRFLSLRMDTYAAEMFYNYLYIGVLFFSINFLLHAFWKNSWNQIKLAPNGYLLKCFLIAILFVGILQGVFAELHIFVTGIHHFASENQSRVTNLVKCFPILAFFQTIVFGPFIEESIFRGVIFRSIRKCNVPLAIILSSLIFAVMHLRTEIFTMEWNKVFVEIIEYIGMGIGLSIVYEKKKNIMLCVWVHSFFNILAYIKIFI